jgi:hypothetical protein
MGWRILVFYPGSETRDKIYTDLNIKHRSTYVYIMYMDMSKYNLGRQPNYYMWLIYNRQYNFTKFC